MRAFSRCSLLLLSVTALAGAGCSSTARRTVVDHNVEAPPRKAEALTANESGAGESDKERAASLQPVSQQNRSAALAAHVPGSTDEQTRGLEVAAAFQADEGSSPDGITLAALEQLALQNNPAIDQLSATAARARGLQWQVGLRPNPSVGYFGDEIGNEGAGGLNGAFVSQTFVRGDKLQWSQEVLRHDVDAALWQVDVQRRRVLTDVRVQFYAALVAQERLRLAREFREVAYKGVQVSEDRVRAKLGARPDVLQSQIQLNEVELLIQQAEFAYDAAWNELTATIGLPALARETLAGDLEAPVIDRDAQALYQQILSTSPLLAAASARVNRARANIQRQQVQPIPNLNAQVGAGHDDATGDAFANVQLSLPLPLHNKNGGNISAAHAEYCAAVQNVERIRMQMRRDLARVMREYNIASVTVQRYRDAILPQARESLELILEAQQAGQYDFLRVLTARRQFFDANLAYVAALGELAQSNARLDGLLLAGGLENVPVDDVNDDLRSQALSGQ